MKLISIQAVDEQTEQIICKLRFPRSPLIELCHIETKTAVIPNNGRYSWIKCTRKNIENNLKNAKLHSLRHIDR